MEPVGWLGDGDNFGMGWHVPADAFSAAARSAGGGGMKRVNWPIVALGVLWWWMETSYFGHNVGPKSVAELFADGMALAFTPLPSRSRRAGSASPTSRSR
ncbi:hypothetical protein SNK04_013834 [Fusarium graminearum]